jgi:RNA polymerase sigma factor (sigma-70 family)
MAAPDRHETEQHEAVQHEPVQQQRERHETGAPALPEAVGERGVLLGLCYRLLGSLTDAEDAVQETYVRWYRLTDEERAAIDSPRSWLMKVASRICLDMIGSARARREQYVGEWLPEPLPQTALWSSSAPGDRGVDPSDRVTLDESVSMALLVVLESMTPAERVAFVLHDVFAYSFAEVGDIVGRSPEASRQLATSARRHVREARTSPGAAARHSAIVQSFADALQAGDVAAVLRMLDPDATAIADGGGKVRAAREPIRGAAAIAEHYLGVLSARPGLHVRASIVNGAPGLVVELAGRTTAVIAIGVSDAGLIERIWAVRNPEKLGAWA